MTLPIFTDAQHACLAAAHDDGMCSPDCLWARDFHPDEDRCARCYHARYLHPVDGSRPVFGVCDNFI